MDEISHLVSVVQNAEKYDGWEGPLHYQIASGHTTDAAMRLAELGGEEALQTLISALKNTHYGLPADMAKALGKLGHKDAVEPLIESLNHQDDEVQQEVISALGEIGDQRAVDPLIEKLMDWRMCARAAKALGKLRAEKSLERLWMVALNHDDVFYRIEASKAIGIISGAKSTDTFVQTLNDEDEFKRFVATVALGQIGDRKASPALVEILHQSHSKILGHMYLDIVGESINSLGLIKDENVIEDLINLAMTGHYTDSVVKAIRNIGGSKGINLLIQLMKHEDDEIRILAIDLLSTLNLETSSPPMREASSEECVEAFIQSLEDTNHVVVNTAIYALGTVRDLKAIKSLILSYDKERYSKRNNLTSTALRNITNNLTETLIETFKNGSSQIRRHIKYGLLNSSSQNDTETLIGTLEDNDDELRLVVIPILAQINDSKSVKPLMKLLNDDDSEIREASIDALGKLGFPQATEPLMELFNDGDSKIRIAITRALGGIKDPNSLEMIENIALNDIDTDVRISAVYSIGRIGKSSSKETLTILLYDPIEKINQTAAESLFDCIADSGIPLVEEAFKNNEAMLNDVLNSWNRKKWINMAL